MREITSHRVNPANDTIKITVQDEPGSGGANHRYDVTGYDGTENPSYMMSPLPRSTYGGVSIIFQNGPIAENGVNGVTQEVLLAIIIDRLQSFQKGPYASRENALALTKLEEAKHWLFARTLERITRGVEGTSTK
jgi:hypothetical protein